MSHSMITRSKQNNNNINNTNNTTDIDQPMQPMHNAVNQQTIQAMKNMGVSIPNMYDGQQVCSGRDMSMSEYYEDALEHYPQKIDIYLQHLYDIGCSMMTFQIIEKDSNNNFKLNKQFGDYYDWSYSEQNVVDNCNFLRKMGHKLYV